MPDSPAAMPTDRMPGREPATEAPAGPGWAARWVPNGEWALLLVLAFEVAVFSITGTNFLTLGNAFEITRLAAEIGLLAFALTLVIKTGGIDLSVGSMMGLAAVTMGGLWANYGFPIWIAALAALAVGGLGGALNGVLITRIRVPALIVTLGTFSLFRGLAEALTGGYSTYVGLPHGFLQLGQGYLGGWIPTQFLLVGACFCLMWLWLHRRPFGRELTAIGFNPEGARFAGIATGRAVFRVYVLCGACAALAGVIYVARLGQAKADAGLGYELLAIAAVVLGGTSIAGGRGTLHGTLLGLLCLVTLQNGLRLSGQPSEVAGLLAGAILIGAIALNQAWARRQLSFSATPAAGLPHSPLAFDMKNIHVALIIGAILLGALLIAASNLFVVRALTSSGRGEAFGPAPTPTKRLVVALTPKARADPYFVSCKEGADEAAAELGVELLWDGPTDPDPARQNEIVEAWITRGVDVIAASAASPEAISTVLRKAQQRGIKVITWDADARPDARSFFVNQATAQGIGYTLADEAARLIGGTGKYAIITASLTDANQNEWIKHIRDRMAAQYPNMELADIRPSDGQRDKAMTETRNVLRAHPDVRAIIAVAAPAVPGAAEALRQEGRRNVMLTGLSTPNLSREYINEGWAQSIVLWNTMNLGYLTVRAAAAVARGELQPGATAIGAGKLGSIDVADDQILLGEPFIFTKENIAQFQF
jgi:ribose/xylose/arabinose/galactoside ABC-type transport system permease subunit/ABC-type sugar transport system substrate-binding protein